MDHLPGTSLHEDPNLAKNCASSEIRDITPVISMEQRVRAEQGYHLLNGRPAPVCPAGCMFIDGTRIGGYKISGTVCPQDDQIAGADKYESGLHIIGSEKNCPSVVPCMFPDVLQEVQDVGSGGFGVVRLAEVKDASQSSLVVVKKPMNDEALPHLAIETRMHAQLQHERILPLQAILLSKENPLVCAGLVLPYCERGNLGDWLASCRRCERCPLVPWGSRLQLAEQILEGLAYLHSVGICHLDLKAGNILLCEPDVGAKLADFGLARSCDGSAIPGRYRGTWPHMPPEMAKYPRTLVAPALDVWSFGVLLLDMVRSVPLTHNMTADKIKRMLRGDMMYTQLERDPAVNCEVEWLHLVKRCLQYDPSRRPTATQLLQHVRDLRCQFMPSVRTTGSHFQANYSVGCQTTTIPAH